MVLPHLIQPLTEDPNAFARLTVEDHLAVVEHHHRFTQHANLFWRLAHEDDGSALLLELPDPIETLALEPLITNG